MWVWIEAAAVAVAECGIDYTLCNITTGLQLEKALQLGCKTHASASLCLPLSLSLSLVVSLHWLLQHWIRLDEAAWPAAGHAQRASQLSWHRVAHKVATSLLHMKCVCVCVRVLTFGVATTAHSSRRTASGFCSAADVATHKHIHSTCNVQRATCYVLRATATKLIS